MAFNIQKAIDIIKKRTELGIKVNGHRIDILRFADDIAIIAESEKHLKKILGTLEQIMERDLHMKINAKNTKVFLLQGTLTFILERTY